jgi:acyl carrier protein
MTTTFDAIRAIIVRDFELPPERLRPETLLEEIELDSLAITELVFAIEDEFHITAENTIPQFKTLGDIADYVARLVAERDATPRVVATSVGPAATPAGAGATPKRPRSGVKKAPSVRGASKPRSAANGASSGTGKLSGSAREVNGKAERRTNGENGENVVNGGGGAGRTKPARAASGQAARPRGPRRSGGGRAGTRAR